MVATDRARWDERYEGAGPTSLHEVGPPQRWAAHAHRFPTSGRACELACGRGRSAVWLARRGLETWASDVSPVAIELARDLARRAGVEDRCHLEVADLDDGLPPGPPVDVVVCNMFRDPRLDDAIVERLLPNGLLAIATLSEVDASPGRHRARAGELPDAFPSLEVIEAGERGGEAWLLARRT